MVETKEDVEFVQNNIIVLKKWDKTSGSLEKEPGLRELIEEVGFAISDLVPLLSSQFPENIKLEEVNDSEGNLIEKVGTEILTVGGKTLDRLLVVAFPAAAKQNLKEMTRFKAGGEVILIIDGKAELTFAKRIVGDAVHQEDLSKIEVNTGDLIISKDVPNNWSKVLGESFSFIYFVGNPLGDQKYGRVPKSVVKVEES